MSISDFRVSESSSAKFKSDLDRMTEDLAAELAVAAPGPSANALFVLEKFRLEQLERFLEANPPGLQAELASRKSCAGVDLPAQGGPLLALRPTVHAPADPPPRKRGSMFQTGVAKEKIAVFKRHSVAPLLSEKLGAFAGPLQDVPSGSEGGGSDWGSDASDVEEETEGGTAGKEGSVASDKLPLPAWSLKVVGVGEDGHLDSRNSYLCLQAQEKEGGKVQQVALKDKVAYLAVAQTLDAPLTLTLDCSAPKDEASMSCFGDNWSDWEAIRTGNDSTVLSYSLSDHSVRVARLPRPQQPSLLPNEVRITLDPSLPAQYHLELRDAFFGAYLQLSAARFHSRLLLRPGTMFLSGKSQGFLVKEWTDCAADPAAHHRLTSDSSTLFWAADLQLTDLSRMELGFRHAAENPSSSSSSSSQALFSLDDEIQAVLRRQFTDRRPFAVLLTPFKYLSRHKTYKFDREIVVFHLDKTPDASFRLRFGPKKRQELTVAGFAGVCPLMGLRGDWDLTVGRTDNHLWLQYGAFEGNNAPLTDLLDPKRPPNFLTDAGHPKGGLWVNVGLFEEGSELLRGGAVNVPCACRVRTASHIYEVQGPPSNK